jgi:tetratricopeptide (TPR) repeat protein
MMGAVSLHRHDPSEAVPYFEKYVSLEPNDPRGRFALGLARFHSKDFDGAQRDLAEVAGRVETAAGANYFLARIARQSGRLDQARDHVDRALQANPDYADAWAELGLLQTRGGQYPQAEQSLQKALSLDSENYQATVNLTALYTRTRDPRRDQQAARLDALQKKRSERAQDFLRMVEFVPPSY